MKKILPILMLLFLLSKAVSAQTPYGVYQISFAPEVFEQTNFISLPDDRYTEAINIGFPFIFFGQSYDSLLISSNGYVRFELGYANNFSDFSVSQSLPDSIAPTSSIFLSWFDLNPNLQPLISYATIGVAPNRIFVVNYNSVPYFACTSSLYVGQLKLYEGSNNIEMHITDKQLCNSGTPWGNFAIEGIQNSNGTEAYHVPGRNNNGVWQTSNDAWRFDPDTVSAEACVMTGRVIADFNGNCIVDGNDYALPGQVVIRDGNQVFTSTNQAGIYSFEADTGNYQISFNGLNDNLPFGTINCPQNATFNLNITEAGTIADSLDFFIYPDSTCADPQIHISPVGPFRRCAGNDNHQAIFVTNHGLLPVENYSVSLTLPDSLYLYNTEPAFSSQEGNTYTWNFNDTLLFGELTSIHLYDSLSCYATDGLLKCLAATVGSSNDCNTSNNISDICQIVNGSYDPNHIQLLSAPPTPQYVYSMEVEGNEQWYTYRIQFQNTGTAPAQTVVVTDILPSFFDYSTAELLGASHECMLVNTGDGTLKFVHYFINLPDSSENFAGSIGTVLFRVKTNQVLLPGQEIANLASIVFDVNEPVITNDAIFEVPLTNGINTINPKIDIYPNPVDRTFTVSSEFSKGTLQITDLSGRIFKAETINNFQQNIETTDISEGVYLVELIYNNVKIATQKLIVSH
jgi:hypothetical protein